MNKIIVVVFLFCSGGLLKAQPTLDTILMCLTQKPHVFLKVDTRNSFIENSRAKVTGIKLGIGYADRLFFGVGYNQLYPNSSNFNEEIRFTNSLGKKDSTTAKLNLYYISAHVEYVFHQTKHWKLSMPLQVGFGKVYYKYKLNDETIKDKESVNFIYEPAISIEYKLLKWIGVGADVGYRFMITSQSKLNQKFTSPIYAFKFLIYYSDLYHELFPKKNKSSKHSS